MEQGKVTTRGGLDRDVVAKVLRRHQNENPVLLRIAAVEEIPALSGKLVLLLTIDATGSVKKAELERTSPLRCGAAGLRSGPGASLEFAESRVTVRTSTATIP